MNRLKFISLVLILLTCSASFLYYILVNTAFAEHILPNVNFAGKQISFANQTELNTFINSYSDNSEKKLEVQFDDIKFFVPIKELGISFSQDEIQNYGKGSDFFKVFSEGLTILGGREIDLKVNLDPEVIIKYFPFKTAVSTSSSRIDGQIIRNCGSDVYNLSFRKEALLSYAKEAILFNTPLTISLSDILKDPIQKDIIKACLEYKNQLSNLFSKLNNIPEAKNIEKALLFQKINNKYQFTISNFDLVNQIFINIKSISDKAPYDGKYVVKENKAYLYEKYINGKSLDLDKTIDNFNQWLVNTKKEILYFNDIKAPVVSGQYEVIDVTKILSQGKTRIDIIRDGKYNWGMVNAEYGLKALNDFVINPKSEFSFLRDSGADSHSYYIGGGVCNATTTVYRAAIEAGFEIKERHQHGYNVASYAWGYPENVVDAAFMSADPRVDLRFINDLDYPVLIKLEITRDNNNFQYHTISFYTSPNIPERKVELYDFKKWNIRSNTVFDGSFSRKVYESGSLIREDTTVSKYR